MVAPIRFHSNFSLGFPCASVYVRVLAVYGWGVRSRSSLLMWNPGLWELWKPESVTDALTWWWPSHIMSRSRIITEKISNDHKGGDRLDLGTVIWWLVVGTGLFRCPFHGESNSPSIHILQPWVYDSSIMPLSRVFPLFTWLGYFTNFE